MICEICGERIEKSMFSGGIYCSKQCFHAKYWLERVMNKDSKTQVVIDNTVYQIDREDSSSCFRGFDGRTFYIKFNDGRIVKTTNLWHNGTVPEAFRELLPDNAQWSNNDEWSEYVKQKI